MVYLNRIYTRTGDGGMTALGNGTQVSKTHLRISAYGGVDELNSVLGLAIAVGLECELVNWIRQIQNDLFDVGADLCIPEDDDAGDQTVATPLRVTSRYASRLETWIDTINDKLDPLTSFILPGGGVAASHLHLARSVCRRVEVGVCHLAEVERVNPEVQIYLNRLSDLLFVLARLCNDSGKKDVLWIPGGPDGQTQT